MAYIFLDYRRARDGEGLEPECPSDAPFLLLADLRGLNWGLFEIDVGSDWRGGHPVGDDLATLIESAKRYPPALAIARHEMSQVFGDHEPSRREFSAAYAAALRNHLERQFETPYVVAPAMREEGDYLSIGEWYWILGVSGTPPVASWVSGDFQIYEDDMAFFDLTGEQLRKLGFVG